MTYNAELQSNNADLQSILDAVNALPEAGGGGDTHENVTLNFSWTAPSSTYRPAVFYTRFNSDALLAQNAYEPATGTSGNIPLTVAKGHLVFITCKYTSSPHYGVQTYTASDGITAPINLATALAGLAWRNFAFLVSDDSTLSVDIGSTTGGSGGSV